MSDTPRPEEELWKEIYELRDQIKGPPGYATWADAATAEKVKRIALERELAAALVDAKRLDWLEQHPRHAQIIIDGVSKDAVFYGISCHELVKLRDAIDAARK